MQVDTLYLTILHNVMFSHQIPSCGFPTGELFRGSAAHRALQMDKDSPPPSLLSAGSRQDRTPPVEEIALIIFWQVGKAFPDQNVHCFVTIDYYYRCTSTCTLILTPHFL